MGNSCFKKKNQQDQGRNDQKQQSPQEYETFNLENIKKNDPKFYKCIKRMSTGLNGIDCQAEIENYNNIRSVIKNSIE